MNGSFLLDTNIVIAFLAEEVVVVNHVTAADEVFIPVVALGELYYGAHESSRVRANLARIAELSGTSDVLGCDVATARRYGRIKSQVHRRGRPIPEADLWIAAIAAQHGLTLASRDRHFAQVEGLPLAVW